MSAEDAKMQQPWFPLHRLRFAVAALGALLVAGAAVQTFRDNVQDRSPGAGQQSAGEEPADIVRLERKVKEDPRDAAAWAELGSAYVTAARVASNPTFYPKAERALDRSLALEDAGRNWQALAGKGALAAGRHDFVNGRAFSERARALNPHSPFIRGLIVDCLTELGRYPEAVQAAQEMVDLKPNFASFSRVSYQRELHGDVDGAIEAFQSALEAAGTPSDKAFAVYHLGELEFNRGSTAPAERHYRTVLKIDPQFAQALAGLGKVKNARGDRSGAIAEYRKAVAIFPDPELLKELGDLHSVEGNKRKAAASYALMERENEKQHAHGVNINLEIALSSADRKTDLDRGLAAAKEEWSLRQSIHVADALAWQLHVHGKHEEAIGYADHALKLGMKNASMHFHRAEINRALGRIDAARADYEAARTINPHFSPLYEERLRRS